MISDVGQNKSRTGHVISVPLFGVGVVTIPANAECVELEETTAEAIQAMTYVKILEETEPKLKESPLVKAVEEVDLGGLEEVEEAPKPAPKKRPSRAKK